MNRNQSIFILLVSFCLLAQIALAQEEKILRHGGYDRNYLVHIPENSDEGQPSSLIIMLHGAGGSALEMYSRTSFATLAEETNSIVVYPNGIQQGWNFLTREDIHPLDLYTDDIGFLEMLIDEISVSYAIDESRVYLAGFSNGGMLALRGMCDLSERLAGVVVIAANFRYESARYCTNTNPIPIMLVIGMQDQVFPWVGFALKRPDGLFRLGLSVQQTMALMTRLNECNRQEGSLEQISTNNSPFIVIREQYTICTDDAEVVLYAIRDYGHRYPFEPRVVLENGETGDIQQAIWEFLFRHKREN